ncbi:MAG: YraN family protein [Planctomycetota bacterium]
MSRSLLQRIQARIHRWWSGSRAVGRRGERVAARFLRRHGLVWLDSNVRLGALEIDLIFLDDDCLVFVEVKSTTDRSWSRDLDKIDRRKARALRAAASRYLSRRGWDSVRYRIDVVTVEFHATGPFSGSTIRWFRSVLALN